MRTRKFSNFFLILSAATVSGGCVLEDLAYLPEVQGFLVLLQDLFAQVF